MKLSRRTFLQSAAGAAAIPFMSGAGASRHAWAQGYPVRPVRILVGFPAGGTTDIGARLVAQWLSERLGQQFVIENRPGAGTRTATDAVAQSAADGHTLLMCTTTNVINATLYNSNFLGDFVPVAGVIRSPFVLEVNPAVPIKSVAELIAHAKANPGKLNMASFGVGSSSHLTGELFKMTAAVDMQHVPYRGSAPMLVDLLSGQVQLAFDNLPASIEHIRAGKLRPLAVTTATRSDALPDVPTLGETLPGFESSAWIGIAAPKGTPADIVDRLNKEINAGLADPKLKARLADLSGMILGGTVEEFTKHAAAETEKWGKVIRATNVKPE